ncbi:MAG: alpha/beta hydrolase [Xylophilus ampelinus]
MASRSSSLPCGDTTFGRIDAPFLQPLAVRFYGRRPARGAAPLAVHFHGGHFIAGGIARGSAVARLLAEAGAVVVSLDYPLAPAHPFPAAVEAGHRALDWVARHRTRLAGAGAPLFVAGEEAGGNLAAAVARMARDRRGPALAGQLLLSPMLDPRLGTGSLRAAGAGGADCAWARGWRSYLPRCDDAAHPYAAPGGAARADGLPPALVLSAGDDPLRDEALAHVRCLERAGVPVAARLLPAGAGWPAGLLAPADAGVPWADAVRAHFRAFLRAPGGAAEGAPPGGPGPSAAPRARAAAAARSG